MNQADRDRMEMELARKDGAAFGFHPHMKGRRSKNDREAAKNAPVDLLRGAVAGAAGAPGDIEKLLRMAHAAYRGAKKGELYDSSVDTSTALPTSDEILARLPYGSDTPVSRAASTLGTLAGGAYTGPGAPIRVVASVPGALKHGAQEFAKAAGQPATRMTAPLSAAEREANLQRYLTGNKAEGDYYHGTSHDVTEFDPLRGLEKPGQAGATFVSNNPDFSAGYAKDALTDMATNAHKYLTPEQMQAAIPRAIQYFKETYPDMPKHVAAMTKSLKSGNPEGEALDALQDAYKHFMPSGPNIMPVHVRTTNPFNPANPEHVSALQQINPQLPFDEIGRTSVMERPEVQDAIKAAGFDAFYTTEGGNRNLGLFDPRQLKSKTGNVGTYDIDDPRLGYAVGGSVDVLDDFTTPDMSDANRFFPDPDYIRLALQQQR